MDERDRLLREASAEGTFLGRLSDDVREALLADANILRARRGQTIFSAESTADRFGIVARGMVRTYMASGDGRRLSVRYARSGAMVGSITAGRAALSVQAVSDCVLLEMRLSTLQRLIAADGVVGLVLIGEIVQRLQDTYATLASNTFGSMRERVARQLMDASMEEPDGHGLCATVTQQGLADGVGTVREVVARVLRRFREEGLITTTPGHIRIVDAERLAAIIERAEEGHGS